MRYLVVYDVSEDKVRSRVCDICEAFGVRVQESVFECELDDGGLADLARRLGGAIEDPGTANVRIYRVCRDCLAAAIGIGGVAEGIGDAPCLII